MSDERREQVRQHITSFPRYVSHYRRTSAPDRKYITAVYSVAEMYRAYKTKCEEDSARPVTASYYASVSNTEFNISFKPPLQDTCQICDRQLARAPDAPPDPPTMLHLARAQAAKDAFKADKAAAVNPLEPACITMDLQQALPTPHIPTSVVFYMRQLWTYNFGIHLCDDNSAVMCVWPEHVASRGADEVGSCLLKALPTMLHNKRRLICVV